MLKAIRLFEITKGGNVEKMVRFMLYSFNLLKSWEAGDEAARKMKVDTLTINTS